MQYRRTVLFLIFSMIFRFLCLVWFVVLVSIYSVATPDPYSVSSEDYPFELGSNFSTHPFLFLFFLLLVPYWQTHLWSIRFWVSGLFVRSFKPRTLDLRSLIPPFNYKSRPTRRRLSISFPEHTVRFDICTILLRNFTKFALVTLVVVV